MKQIIGGLSVACIVSAFGSAAFALELGAPFTDGAVLQRGMKVPVWGTADAGETVTVSFGGQTKTATAGADGKWCAELDPMPASAAGRPLAVKSNNSKSSNQAILQDVLVGEVWFASGQSNMECPVWGRDGRYRDANGGLVTQMTRLDKVRFVKNPRVWSVTPKKLKATWRRFEPKSFADNNQLSAIAFYYARELYLALGVPVGIIDSSWGGTNIDAWTPRCGYADCPAELKPTADYPVRADFDRKRDGKGPVSGGNQQPTVLWNGMVDAYAPMAARGMIWYQGCHNAGEAPLYCAKMHALYKGWSTAFRNPGFKLYFVQLAPYNQNWNALVAAQNRFAAEERNAAIALTADVGNFDDIHPNTKEVVGKRLAAQALARDYGFGGFDPDSPTFRSMRVEGDAAILAFDHAESWYVYAPNRSLEVPFELAGADGRWQPAKIQNKQDKRGPIEGRELVLKAEGVTAPVRVRYMGRARTMGTLFNGRSLPLGPFEASVADERR